jgi:DNA-directed RNA polymerase subunit beta'
MHKQSFDGLVVKLASAQTIEKRSHGIVDHADTVNYRTGKPKHKWLFCESIFWPIRNYECSCGKYKWVRYKWVVCERCWVEVTNARVRRERMGHIDLATPVIHVWYQSGVSGGIHHLLWLSGNEIQKILWFVKYIVTSNVTDESREKMFLSLEENVKSTLVRIDEMYLQEKEVIASNAKASKNALQDLDSKYIANKNDIEQEFNRVKNIISDLDRGSTILESDYRNIFSNFDDVVSFHSWPLAIYNLLKSLDVKKEIDKNLKEFPTIKSVEKRKKIFILIKLLINLYSSGVAPENMVITKLPVIPPDLRPVVQLDGGRFATSDVNLFYRRVLMRNIRLKKMIQVGMPDVVKKNEIRLLQEAVNNLFVWEKQAAGGSGTKVSKSLSDMLSGKEGIFRRNLLGKRVDYSGRSVITVWPNLKLDECGIPLYIAMRIFSPFVVGKLIQKKITYTPKQAEKMIKEGHPLALKYLEEVVKDKYVLLNRAPTLHRLSIEAFKVKLMPGKTIRLHPLVCTSFNADFDGDQMAVHLPISYEAQQEAKNLIAADKNVLKPTDGQPAITHSQDMVHGIYYLTDDKIHAGVFVGYYDSFETVISSYNSSSVWLKDKITLVLDGQTPIETTVGRVLFNSVLPQSDIAFINETINKKKLHNLLNRIFDEFGQEAAVKVADAIKDLWFKFATHSGLSISAIGIQIPQEKEQILKEGDDKINEIYKYYYKWFLSDDEKHRQIVQVWSDVKSQIEAIVKKMLIAAGDDVFAMIDSWARWSYNNSTQILGMKGLVMNQTGKIIELPIKGNFVEWLTPIEYFISSHTARKGKADTALRTADSWYLTRKLCDASQEVVVKEHDCDTTDSLIVSKMEVESYNGDFEETLYGRVLASDVIDWYGNVILHTWDMLDKKKLNMILTADIDLINIRSPMICKTVSGVCQKCYGMDLATREIVNLGTPVGIIAAQSIGEPSTQLTMDTFHKWWVVSAWEDMAQGIDRVKQLFEVRKPKTSAIIAPFDGTVRFYEKWKMKFMSLQSEFAQETLLFKEWYTLTVKKWDSLVKWSIYAMKGTSKMKVKEDGMVLEVSKDHIVFGTKKLTEYSLTGLNPLISNEWESVYKWQILTTWAVDIKEYQEVVGDIEAMKYMLRQVNGVYWVQGQAINDKHIEIIIKQLFSKVFIYDAGNSSLIPGSHAKYEDVVTINKQLEAAGKKPCVYKRMVLWLTSIAKETDSWLSSASFQETIRVMVDASLKWAVDDLNDLKANVIIGRLLPIGQEFVARQERNAFDLGMTHDQTTITHSDTID